MDDDFDTVAMEHEPRLDADTSGRLASALFIAVIALLLVLIYALATAA